MRWVQFSAAGRTAVFQTATFSGPSGVGWSPCTARVAALARAATMNWARQSVNGACHAVASERRRHRRPHIMLRAPGGHSGGRTEAFCIAILDVVIAKTEAPYQMADSSQTGTSGNSGTAFLGVPGILFFFLGLRDLLGLFAWPFADIAEIAARAALPLTRCGSVVLRVLRVIRNAFQLNSIFQLF